ncbi:MAG: HAMP domain-containing histidine kinase [Saprospiraceae bacterium]|nr:HAMP domain-containing histidine kinase [Saprospiraceae bacterium]
MKKWHKDPVAWSMVISMVLLVGLASFWLRGTYHMLQHTIKRQADFLFANAVRSVEDSLIESSLSDEIELLSRDSSPPRTRLLVQIDSSSVGRSLPHDTLMGNRILRRQWREKRRERNKEDIFGAIGWQLSFLNNNRLHDAIARDSIGREIFLLIDRQVQMKFAAVDFPGRYEFGHGSNTGPGYSKVYHDVYTEKEFQLAVFPNPWKTIRMMSWQIAIVFLTFIVTLFSFVLTYRSLSKQRQLTLFKNDLISNISHELKTPISTLKVALEALEGFEAGPNPQQRKEYLQISKSELDRLALLVDNVLKTSQAENTLNFKFEIGDLNALIQKTLDSMQLHFDKVGAIVDFKSSAPAYCSFDRLHMTSVIYNLIDNAVKYSRDNPRISIELCKSGTLLKLIVADQGVGISSEFLPNIFDKFFRVPGSDIHDVKGYGMGLSYVANVIKQHGGTIRVESEPGSGTRFIIILPGADV